MAKYSVDKTFSDDDVIRSVKNGHLQDYEIIIERYKAKIVNFIFRMIFDYEEAESISQDVFIKIYSKINRYREQDNFKSYIYRVAKNFTLNYIKKNKRSVNFSSYFGSRNSEEIVRSNDSPVNKLEDEEKDRLIIFGLKQLGEEQRLALIMKIYLHLSYVEIADISGWSVPKIESLISRAKKKLYMIIKMQEKSE